LSGSKRGRPLFPVFASVEIRDVPAGVSSTRIPFGFVPLFAMRTMPPFVHEVILAWFAVTGQAKTCAALSCPFSDNASLCYNAP
jgi:hypothetical protein